ncbi:MAG: OmpA family protein [Bacteroidota bacterium]
MLTRVLLLLFIATPLALLVPPAEAQSIFERARRAAERGAERAVEREAERRADRAVSGAIECVLGDSACARQAQEDGREVVYVDDEGNPVPDDQTPGNDDAGASGDPENLRPGEGVWANYDFVPGDRVLFFDDFEDDYVGNFPRRLEFKYGTMEVVEWQGARLLRGTGGDRFTIPLPETLPERFTVEFDIHDPATEGGTSIVFGEVPNRLADYERPYVNIGNWRGSGLWHYEDGRISTNAIEQIEEEVVPIRIAVDGDYIKVYAAEQRITNVPNADLGRANAITVFMSSRTDRPIYLGNVRIASGGREILYDKLQADGRVALGGLLFDTGSATLRPESTPTLQDLTRTLERNPDLRLRIEGHTDNTGNGEANQRLSQDRADAVRTYLAGQGIDASRLETQGFGDANPVADNATPEGRQTNRRVEIVKL